MSCSILLGLGRVALAKTIPESDFAEIQKLVPKSDRLLKTIPRLKERVKTSPSDVDLRLLLAKAHLSAGETKEALTVLRAINLDSEPRALVLMALAFELDNDPLEKIRSLELLRKTHPESEWVALELGKTYLRTNNTAKSTEMFRARITAAPKSPKPYYGLLEVYEKTKNNYESRILLTDMLTRFPKDKEPYNRLCKINALGSFIEDALEVCPKAIELSPRLADNHIYYGLAKKYNKEPEASEKILKKAAQQFPKSEFAQKSYAELLLEQKNFEGAKKVYVTCSKYHPKSGYCMLGKANSTFQMSQFDEALPYYSKACELDPQTRNEFRNAIAALRIKEKFDVAETYNKAFEKCGVNLTADEEN